MVMNEWWWDAIAGKIGTRIQNWWPPSGKWKLFSQEEFHFHLHKTTSGTFNSQVTGAILHTSTNNPTLILNMSIKKMVFLLY